MADIVYVSFKDNVLLAQGTFGELNGDPIKKFSWKTESGLEITVITFGAIIQAIKYPDKNGVVKDIALGFSSVQDYVKMNVPDLTGCVVGRCVNRVRDASFTIDGIVYNIDRNWKDHHLHGGRGGFHQVNWTADVDGNKVVLSYISKDGDQGYPGDLLTNITYEVKNDDTFHVTYTALTNGKTIVNLTNHSYFNLAGHDSGCVGLYEHTVVINSDKILEGDDDWIPNGRFRKVGGTPFDFRSAKRLGDLISNEPDNLRYHHNFVINMNGKEMLFVSRVEHPPSGRYLEIYSDQPSVVFYTGNYIQGQGHPDMVGKDGYIYGRCAGLCLEPMNLVDAIHHEHFPSPILRPGDVYTNRMHFRFGAEEMAANAD
ncbi:hypothetical protein O0L34_g10366 [Tuta absoluta]|nr:hypothetical protein O0L34_g10366 [Tuta absoluta]